ncbi:MAG: rod shape-determining protein MreC [Candidatus Arsenophonus melophagi]|nr:rod shape-determining protein MreC [Candidatus Arsenophonus melophagi]
MKPIFNRGASLQLRTIIAIVFAIILVAFNRQCNTLSKVSSYLNIAMSPFYFLANGPKKLLDNLSDALKKRNQLLFENKVLKKEVLLKKADNLLLEQLKHENAKLRELLGSPVRPEEHMMVTQVFSSANTPYRYQIVIDKGSRDGVYEGQPVLSDKGVVGQVIAVSYFNSRVLLICDTTHALPIQILRNGIRVIAVGTGCSHDLQFELLPDNIDVRIGDVIVTSGLGGRFPEGYPVAIVSSVKHEAQRAYTIIHARPTADLQRLQYLLLLWGNFGSHANNPVLPSEVHRAKNERFRKIIPPVLPRSIGLQE